MSSSWQRWVDQLNLDRSSWQQEMFLTQQMIRQWKEGLPEQSAKGVVVEWVTDQVTPKAGRGLHPMKGSPLAALLMVGSHGAFDPWDPDQTPAPGPDWKNRSIAKNSRIEEIRAIGDQILRQGGEPTADLWEIACSVGGARADMLGRIQTVIRWGGLNAPRLDPRKALSACAKNSLWAKEDAQRAWKEMAGLPGWTPAELDWKSVPLASHALAQAILHGSEELVQTMIQSKAGLDWKDPASGMTLWHLAAHAKIPKVKPLWPALIKEAQGVVSQAMTATVSEPAWLWGTQPTVLKKGRAVAHMACEEVKPEALAAAIQAGADLNAKDEQGDTPLLILARRWGAKAQKKSEPMVKALLEAGADPSIAGAKGKLPAQVMAAKGPLGALAPLLEARPQAIGSESPSAQKAFEELQARGDQGRSQAERALFQTQTDGRRDEAPRESKAPKKRRAI